MLCSVHAPNAYICKYGAQLLPGWSEPVASVLVVLQSCQQPFLERTPATEQKKAWLRDQFLAFGSQVALELQSRGYQADLFDPRTGLPLMSPPGDKHLDDVALVQAVLGYETSDRNGCSLVLHPTLGAAVYPSTLVSSAPPSVLESVVNDVLSELTLQH